MLESKTAAYIPPSIKFPPLQKSRQVIQEVHLSGSEFSKIQQMAAMTPMESPSIKLRREKQALNEKSTQVVKRWDNTVLGQRRKRLQNLNDKAKAAEDERVRLDAEWAQIQLEERSEAVDRARKMQRFESARYKTLHSQLLLSSVLLERDMQVTLKKEREAANAVARKIAQQEDGIGPFIQTEQEESNTKELRRLERLKIAEYQVQQANLKLSKEDEEKQAKFEYYYNINKSISDEQKLAREENAKKSKQAKEIWKRELEQIRDSQQVEKQKVRQADAVLDKSNEKVEKRKLFIAQKMKEITLERFKGQEEVYEKIAHLALESEAKKVEHIEELIEKGIAAHSHDAEDRSEREKAYREALVKDTEINRKIQVERHIKNKIDAKKEVLTWKKEVEEQDAHHVAQVKAKKEKKMAQDQHFKALQRQQIEENRRVAKVLKDKRANELDNETKKIANDNSQFDSYATSLIQDWASSGRDTRLLSHTVQKMKPHAPREHAGKKKVDTFERLGFSLRWMEEPTYPAYPSQQ